MPSGLLWRPGDSIGGGVMKEGERGAKEGRTNLPSWLWLERVSERDLRLTGGTEPDCAIQRAKHVTEGARLSIRKGSTRCAASRQARCRIFVVQAVCQVEELNPKLKRLRSGEVKILAEHHVQLDELGTTQRVARQIAERAGLRRGERRGVEPADTVP